MKIIQCKVYIAKSGREHNVSVVARSREATISIEREARVTVVAKQQWT